MFLRFFNIFFLTLSQQSYKDANITTYIIIDTTKIGSVNQHIFGGSYALQGTRILSSIQKSPSRVPKIDLENR